MGGRIATHVAADDRGLDLSGLVLLGYPLHPPGRPAERRDAHLPSVGRPMLFVQGSRDAFGTPGELEPVLATLRLGRRSTSWRAAITRSRSERRIRRGRRRCSSEAHRAIVEWVRASPD